MSQVKERKGEAKVRREQKRCGVLAVAVCAACAFVEFVIPEAEESGRAVVSPDGAGDRLRAVKKKRHRIDHLDPAQSCLSQRRRTTTLHFPQSLCSQTHTRSAACRTREPATVVGRKRVCLVCHPRCPLNLSLQFSALSSQFVVRLLYFFFCLIYRP